MKSFLFFLKESQLTEGKQEYLKKYSSEPDVKTVIDKFWTIRQRLKNPENDIDWWIKKPYNDFKQFVLNFDTSKNKQSRKQDNYTKEAEKWGAIMFGNFGPYEAWFIPTHEAAVQLGRFYKNISTHWCISTDESRYFDNQYIDCEFIFLISDDKSLKDKQKLALQIKSKTFKLEGVWDIIDNNIINEITQSEKNIINSVLVKFKKLNRSRNDNITKNILIKNGEEMGKNVVNNFLKNVSIIKKDTISKKYKEQLTNIVIPDNITKIDKEAFSRCTSLISITIPNSVKIIGDEAFSHCYSLKSITIPNSVTKISKKAFFRCTSLTSITIPNNVKIIGDWAFWDCTSLTTINIPDSVKSISDNAFYHCYSLKSITIPDSVTSIGNDVFKNCFNLDTVIFSDKSSIIDKIQTDCKKWGLELNQIYIKKAK